MLSNFAFSKNKETVDKKEIKQILNSFMECSVNRAARGLRLNVLQLVKVDLTSVLFNFIFEINTKNKE